MDKAYIYALVDPRDNEVCYVGSTTNIKKREQNHTSFYQLDRIIRTSPTQNKYIQWRLELRQLNLKPILIVLETTKYEGRLKVECSWFMKYVDNEHFVSDYY